MIVDLPDTTTTTAVNKKLDELREKIGAVAMGRVLTLIIAPDSEAMLDSSAFGSSRLRKAFQWPSRSRFPTRRHRVRRLRPR